MSDRRAVPADTLTSGCAVHHVLGDDLHGRTCQGEKRLLDAVGTSECDLMAHAIAEVAIPATEATSPNVSSAPTMDSGAASPEGPAVWLEVDVADEHVDCPSRPPGGMIPPTQGILAGRYTMR